MAHLRLMTANLLNDRADPVQVGEVLGRVRPDVLVTQELGPNGAEVIAGFFSHVHLQPDLVKTGRGIASQRPAEFGDLDLPGRPGSWARLELGDGELAVAGMHMVNPIDFPWWTSASLRTRQLDSLEGWATAMSGEMSVVAGDMNATPIWPVYRRLTSTWRDLVLESSLASGRRPAPTWGWRPGWPKVLRVDHVMGRGVVGLAAWVEEIRGSDHSAVVVDLIPATSQSARQV
ncbi:MAG: endonuclease/exonuclease/phosphatase family protein [Acidimicrobiia bacterium]